MFYCRVLLGEHESIVGRVPDGQKQKRRPSDRSVGPNVGKPYDSILADGRSQHHMGQQKHREFIVRCNHFFSAFRDQLVKVALTTKLFQVFDNARTYPEYVITYRVL